MERQMMILGAGIYQVPLIKKARQLGFHTIVASYPGPYPGFALADEALSRAAARIPSASVVSR